MLVFFIIIGAVVLILAWVVYKAYEYNNKVKRCRNISFEIIRTLHKLGRDVSFSYEFVMYPLERLENARAVCKDLARQLLEAGYVPGSEPLVTHLDGTMSWTACDATTRVVREMERRLDRAG